MYGTAMVAKVKDGRLDAAFEAHRRWLAERGPHVAGYVDSRLLVSDDGRTVVNLVRFESAEAYRKLGEDPEQATFWERHYQPLLDGEPTWVDGEVHEMAA